MYALLKSRPALSDLIGAICAVVNGNVAGTWQEHGATYAECLPETHVKAAAMSPTGAPRFADSKFTETLQFTTSSCCRNRFFCGILTSGNFLSI